MERVAELREARALTLRQLAELSGVDANTINQIELGHREPRPSTVRKLANALDIPVEELERPVNWRARYLEQEAEHAEHLARIVKRAREALKDGFPEYTTRFLELLDEGLQNMAESLHEAHRVETGKKKKKPQKSTADKLSELLREWEAEKAKA